MLKKINSIFLQNSKIKVNRKICKFSRANSLNRFSTNIIEEDFKQLIFQKRKRLLWKSLILRNDHTYMDILRKTVSLLNLLKEMDNKNYSKKSSLSSSYTHYKIIFRNLSESTEIMKTQKNDKTKEISYFLFLIEITNSISVEKILYNKISSLGIDSFYLLKWCRIFLSNLQIFEKFNIETKLKIVYFISFIIKYNFLNKNEMNLFPFEVNSISSDVIKILIQLLNNHLVLMKDSLEVHISYLNTIENILTKFPNKSILLFNYIDHLIEKKYFSLPSILEGDNFKNFSTRCRIFQKILQIFEILIKKNTLDTNFSLYYDNFTKNLKNFLNDYTQTEKNTIMYLPRLLLMFKIDCFIVKYIEEKKNELEFDFFTLSYSILDILLISLSQMTIEKKSSSFVQIRNKIFVIFYVISNLKGSIPIKFVNSVQAEFKVYKYYLKSLDCKKNSDCEVKKQFVFVIESISKVSVLDRKTSKNFLDFVYEIRSMDVGIEM